VGATAEDAAAKAPAEPSSTLPSVALPIDATLTSPAAMALAEVRRSGKAGAGGGASLPPRLPGGSSSASSDEGRNAADAWI
jgi:hypothetical protein